MSTVNLGRVAVLFKGEYDDETTYVKADVVRYNGSSYIAKSETTNHLPTNTTYWDLMVEKGQDGADGQDGSTGPRGPQGNPGATPTVVSSSGDMTDTTKIYVLTTDGHWYYHNGTAWVDGGVYQATAVETDKYLTTPDKAADSEAVGETFSNILVKRKTAVSATLSNKKIIVNHAACAGTGWASYDDGYIGSGAGSEYFVSTKIKIPNFCKKIIFDNQINYVLQFGYTFAFYDENEDFISGIMGIVKNVTVPADAKYFAFGVRDRTASQSTISINYTELYDEKFDSLDERVTNIITKLENQEIELISGQYVNSNGVIVHNNNQNLATTDYLKIPKDCYRITAPTLGVFQATMAFYQQDFTFISLTTEKDYSNIPSNAYFVVFSHYDPNSTVHTGKKVNYYCCKRLDDIESSINSLQDQISTLSDKKWGLLGDSITESNWRTAKNYWGYIHDITDIAIDNCAISGTGYTQYSESTKILSQIDNLDEDCDVITIFAGINDIAWSENPSIGSYTDTLQSNTILGNVNAVLDKLETNFNSSIPIGIISPLPSCIQEGIFANPYQNRTLYPSYGSNNMELFVNGLKQLCEHRGYPFLDMYHTSGLQPQNSACRTALFKASASATPDGLHPNADGHKFIYPKIYEFLKTLIH